MTDSQPVADFDAMIAFRDLLAGRWVGYALRAAAELNIADTLIDGPKNAGAIARETDSDPAAVERLMRALTTVGVFAQRGDGYELTEMGTLLRSDLTLGVRNEVMLACGEHALRNWAQFTQCVRTGRTAMSLLDGVDDPFAWLAKRPDQQASLDAGMAEGTRRNAEPIVEAYDFTGLDTLVDVGGGYGVLLNRILRDYPSMIGITFDQEHCREGAEQLIREEGLSGRHSFVVGDFFADPLPASADAYLLKNVIHDWDDGRSLRVLRACRAAMGDDSRLLLIEIVLPDQVDQRPEYRRMMQADLNMLVQTGGRERTVSAYAALLEAAGLRLDAIVPTRAPLGLSIVEIRPA